MAKKLTTETFIAKAVAKHGEKYDYSKVEYCGCKGKVVIGCHIHGDFEQRAYLHLSGNGCTPCGYSSNGDGCRSTFDEFVEKANEVHDGYYSYPEQPYVNSKVKFKIICPIHEEFEQTPNNHLRGTGCPTCSGLSRSESNKSTFDEFVKKANEVHDGYYSYPEQPYVNSKVKVKIICPLHGDFEQTPAAHLYENGCPTCAGSSRAESNKRTFDEFVKKANEVHDGYYSYPVQTYHGSFVKVKIICPLHGEFTQVPNSHLNGHGCSTCGYLSTWEDRKGTFEEFVKKANVAHEGYYSYPEQPYVNSKVKVKIICPIHGDFEQAPTKHLAGQGCSQCSNAVVSDDDILYIQEARGHYRDGDQVYKIGHTSRRLPDSQRLNQNQNALGSPLTPILHLPIDINMFKASKIEHSAHEYFGDCVTFYHDDGTVRRFPGDTEFFAISADDLSRLIDTVEQFRL